MNKSIMNAKDTVSAKLAECYVTVDGNRYNFMQAIKLEAKMAASLQNLMPTANILTRIWTSLLRILKFLTNSTSLQECKQNNYRGLIIQSLTFFKNERINNYVKIQ